MALLGMLACNLGRLARNAFGKDLSKPDGTPRKLLSAATRVAMRRRPATCLADGLAGPYADWFAHGGSGARRIGGKAGGANRGGQSRSRLNLRNRLRRNSEGS